MGLTKQGVEKARYEGRNNGAHYLWDDDFPGFGVRVFPSGRKSFVLAFRTDQGRKRFLTLGSFPALTVHEARALAKRNAAEVCTGRDPQFDKERRRDAATVADLVKTFMERHSKIHKRTWQKDERQFRCHVLPAWKARKVESITRADVAALHRKIGQGTPIEANRTLALVRKMFNLAHTWGLVDAGHPNPAAGIQMYRETKRDRWVTHEELPRLVAAIDAEANPYVRAALWLYILTGVRKSELLAARWDDVDFTRRELRIPDTKAGRPHVVPLSAQAVAIIGSLPRLDGNPHLFPGRVAGQSLVNISKPWRAIRKAAKLEDVRLHDLRRTVGSWLAMDGTSLLVIGKTLNQTTPSTTQVYARLSEDPVRAALERHAAQVEAVVKGSRADVLKHPTAKGA
ncbi:MAG: tyrosine-type recombinase/integrase [Deltaproteobacteria bacterium]|nr:tyrosine-type recombinase/integrase [Deltaproteobacteria bacterium]